MKGKIGQDQIGLLQSLVSHRYWYGGGWGCGWNWGSTSNTEKILDSLVRRGLASKMIEVVGVQNRPAMVWRPTQAGVDFVAQVKLARVAKVGGAP